MRPIYSLTFLIAWSLCAHAVAAGDTRLVDAVKRQDAATVRTLLKNHVDVNALEADGTTALHWAVRADDVEVAKALINAGARVESPTRLGVTPLMLAATNGSAALTAALLKAGANPNAALPEGETVLMTAARTGNVGTVRALLDAGADVNAAERWRGETALMWAASEDHPDVASALIEHGARLDERSLTLKFPEVRYNLATHGTLPPPQGGFTALMFAARQGAVASARVLAEAGADLNVQDPDGATAMMVAIVNTHYDVAALVLEKGADANAADRAGMTALYAAVDLHALEMYPSRKPPRRSTNPLGSLELIGRLLDHGANPNLALKTVTLRWGVRRGPGDASLGEGATPFMRAARLGDVAAMRLLLDKGADPEQRQKKGTTALLLAAGIGWRTGESILGGLDYGPESDAVDAVRLCLDRGAQVNETDENGETALHGAVARGAAVVRILAERGAKLDAKDKFGRTPLDVALGVRAPGDPPVDRQLSPVRGKSAALLRELMGLAPPVAAAQHQE
jgi:uncharacterized protein